MESTTNERPVGTTATLYLDYVGSPYPILSRALTSTACPGLIKRGLQRLLHDSVYRRNPRTAEYMTSLVAERFGAGAAAQVQPVASRSDLDTAAVRRASRIVLLWRDGNGSGCRAVENAVLAHRAAGSSVTVLNGRRRQFELTRAVRRAYLWRRFLEKSFALEAVAFVIFWLVAPVLAGWDLIRNQR